MIEFIIVLRWNGNAFSSRGKSIVLNYEVTENTYPVTYIINDETLGTVQKGADKLEKVSLQLSV